jgi:hypothetical protein
MSATFKQIRSRSRKELVILAAQASARKKAILLAHSNSLNWCDREEAARSVSWRKNRTAAVTLSLESLNKPKRRREWRLVSDTELVLTLPLSHMRSEGKEGLTATVVVAERWPGSRVTLMLSLTGRMSASSRLPQYLTTAMLVGERPVAMNTHCPSGAIGFLVAPDDGIGFARSGRAAETTRRSGGGTPRANSGLVEFVSFACTSSVSCKTTTTPLVYAL